MFRERHRQHRRPSTPPKESILSNVPGEFLDPIDALFTIFFSILFVLLFTLSYGILLYHGVISSSFTNGYGQELFVIILGAVTAWGVIDGVLYVLGGVLARSERYRLLQYVQTSHSEEEAATAIAYELDFILEPITSDEQRHALYHDIRAYLSQAEPQTVGIQREDVLGGVATVLLSVVGVLPSLLPLLLLPDNTALAIRISNVVSCYLRCGLQLRALHRYKSVEGRFAALICLPGYGSGGYVARRLDHLCCRDSVPELA